VTRRTVRRSTVLAVIGAMVIVAACGEDGSESGPSITQSPASGSSAPDAAETAATSSTSSPVGTSVRFLAEVWADNWFALYVNGELVGEDSVPITTERSFNAESITFDATYPFTVAMVTKDYQETDSGLEYIGTDRQQMGDGGFIAQFTDTSTGEVVATTAPDWRLLVVQRAPLNVDCVASNDPNADCEFEAIDEPNGWKESSFEDSGWESSTIYSEDAVGVKDGYATIEWDPAAALLWSSDLQVDNVILWRATVAEP
jgi:hypothetical protein